MQSSEPPRPLPSPRELQSHLQALATLHRQMLELHARLEYLRLMMRLSAPR